MWRTRSLEVSLTVFLCLLYLSSEAVDNDDQKQIFGRGRKPHPKEQLIWTLPPATPPTPLTYPGPATCVPVACTPVECEQPQRDTVLNISGTGVKTVGELFVQSSHTRELYLDGNEITEMSARAFDGLPMLEVLSLSGNNISTGKLLCLRGHASLRRLLVNDNKRRNESDTSVDMVLHSMPRLQELSLQRDGIHRLAVNLTEFAPRLTRLNLTGNRIESVDFLQNVPATLTHLGLADNLIAALPAGVASNLRELSVGGNRLTVLCDSGCDSGLELAGRTMLTRLDASRNRIASLAEDTFLHTQRLQHLDLSGNQLESVPRNAFDRLTALQELRLDGNRLTLAPNVCQLSSLRHLDLSHNHIAEVIENSFCRLQRLETLLLTDNHIMNVAIRLRTLRSLDLSSNAITEIPENLITESKYLEVLRLKNNSISNIDRLFTERSNVLMHLHLEDNPFNTLRVPGMPQLTVHVRMFRDLNEPEPPLQLDDNPDDSDESNSISDIW